MNQQPTGARLPILLGLSLLLAACGGNSTTGAGSAPTGAPLQRQDISTTPPQGVAGGPISQNGELLTPYVTTNAKTKGAVPTNKFWSSLVFKRYKPANMHSENMFAHPLALKAGANGLGVSYPTNLQITGAGSNSKYQYAYSPDFTLGVSGLSAPDTKADDWSDWTVTAAWDDGVRSLRTTFGHGIPFVYATKSGGNAQISFTATPNVWSNQGNVLGVTINGHHYGIFAPSGATWAQSGATFTSTLAGKDYYSVAALPDGSVGTLNDFKQYAYNFITGTRVSWNYNASGGTLGTTYNITTTPKEGTASGTLMALYRHQWMNSGNVNTAYRYTSPRGEMQVVRGSSFSTQMKFNGTLPWLPTKGSADTNQLNAYINEVRNAPDLLPYRGDSYWAGKSLGRLAEIVPVAEQVGNTGARDAFLNAMKGYLQDWFDGQSPNNFYYNSTWGTLIGYPKGFGSEEELNDHHFHWGYFIQAAAIVAQYDPAWLTAENGRWRNTVNELILDVANIDDANKRYPRLRAFDPYAGHSWASGHAGFGAGNNQESSSEDLHFANALILWGAVTGNTTIRDLGIYLYTNEVHAVEQYWFDINNQTFPTNYPHPVVGMVWGDGGDYSTWFSGEREMIQGINFLPVTAGSLYLGRNPNYLKQNYDYLGREPQYWRDVFWEVYALYDAPGAIAKFGSGNYTPEEGESKAHTYHWIHALNSLGRLDTAVTGNIPTSAVFNKNGTRNYAAYNPTASAITVTFSDGRQMNVPARSNVLNGTGSGGGGSDTTAPTVSVSASPSTLTSAGSVTVTANASDAGGISKVEFYRGGALVSTDTSSPYTHTDSFTSAQNGTYSYTARAFDNAGNNATSGAVNVTVNISSSGGDTQAPSTPGNLTSPSKTSTSISLSWTASTDNVGVSSYDVLRAGVPIATSTTTSFTDSGLNPSTSYIYSVRARDAAGNVSAQSNSITVTTNASGTTPTTRDAYATIQAESYDSQTGTQNVTCGDGSGCQAVGYVGNGDSLVYRGVNFGSTAARTVQLRVASGAASGVSGTVEVRLGGPTGTLLANPSVGNTGGWDAYTTIPYNVSAVTGTHDVYIVFKSGQSADFVNLNWLVFTR
ncbi:glycosyl hydrolase [Deinococcus peraridilitoris]|uniref:glucan endo-1,3-beta-D-glucosidase n=1 Tax=Deinococcus peraridilitoris (strain DSM 19664 / LMG 22246 / CIP 109416 / KR-200) TaxID=937777 RepID=L0A2N5_DEIPD|nr:glycosyl hydrolase [Deinococcus peraridilitoris]AFZ67704.1 putative glycosyl hydrolase [Deinococcus peraridilitoris DSM 19664]